MEFMTLVRFGPESEPTQTKKGIEEFTRHLSQVGGKVTHASAILGDYDLIVQGDVPQIEQVIKALLPLHQTTGWRTKTYPTLPVERFAKVVDEIYATAGTASR